MSGDAARTQRVRLEEQMMTGWTAEIYDFSLTPPKPVPGTKRFIETSQVAALFSNTFSQNTGVLEKPIGLSGLAISPAKSAYLYVEPAKVRPIMTYDGGGKKGIHSMWLPASAWIFRSTLEKSKDWSGPTRLAMVMPDENGQITPKSKVGQYPMSNTYPDYRICWGNVQPPAFKFPVQIRRAIDLFFGSDFNGHTWTFNTDYFEYVKMFSTAKVVKEMGDEERWKMLMSVLPANILRGSLSDFWKTGCGELITEEDE